jgi:hypothetical protein
LGVGQARVVHVCATVSVSDQSGVDMYFWCEGKAV